MNQDQITAKLSQIQSKGLESTFSLSEAALENAEKLAALNYAASKEALVNAQDNFQAVLTAKDPKQVTELMSVEALQEVSDLATDYQRKVTQVLRDSNKEFASVVDASIDEIQSSVQDWMNTLASNAPAGSDVFVSAFKTSYGSMLQGFEQFRAASKEALATAEKSADQAMDTVKGQINQVKKASTPASRGRKAAK
ncbi:MAG: phasin family protein [Burkholderiales bacterium]|nr:phasin family protein [Burkholderiales bacterium]